MPAAAAGCTLHQTGPCTSTQRHARCMLNSGHDHPAGDCWQHLCHQAGSNVRWYVRLSVCVGRQTSTATVDASMVCTAPRLRRAFRISQSRHGDSPLSDPDWWCVPGVNLTIGELLNDPVSCCCTITLAMAITAHQPEPLVQNPAGGHGAWPPYTLILMTWCHNHWHTCMCMYISCTAITLHDTSSTPPSGWTQTSPSGFGWQQKCSTRWHACDV
jgi:hypothetical protein